MAYYYKEIFDGKNWTDESVEVLKNLLEVWDSEHFVIITSPNKVFKFTCEDTHTGNMNFSSWQDITDNIDVDRDNSYKAYTPEAVDAWNYIHHRLSDELNSINNKKKITYLVIVEVDSHNDYLVRGIIEASKKKIRVAVNPLYEQYRPKSTIEKHYRLFSDEASSLKEYIESSKDRPKHLK